MECGREVVFGRLPSSRAGRAARSRAAQIDTYQLFLSYSCVISIFDFEKSGQDDDVIIVVKLTVF